MVQINPYRSLIKQKKVITWKSWLKSIKAVLRFIEVPKEASIQTTTTTSFQSTFGYVPKKTGSIFLRTYYGGLFRASFTTVLILCSAVVMLLLIIPSWRKVNYYQEVRVVLLGASTSALFHGCCRSWVRLRLSPYPNCYWILKSLSY